MLLHPSTLCAHPWQRTWTTWFYTFLPALLHPANVFKNHLDSRWLRIYSLKAETAQGRALKDAGTFSIRALFSVHLFIYVGAKLLSQVISAHGIYGKPPSHLKAAVPSYTSENMAQRHLFSAPSQQGWFCLAGLFQQPFWGITDFHFPKDKHCWVVSVLRWPPEPSLEKCPVKCLKTGLGFTEWFSGYYSWGSKLETNKTFLKCRIEELF